MHKHAPLSEADKAYLSADYAKAESLYRADLATHHGDDDLTEVLFQYLLREEKLDEAAEAVEASLAVNPDSAALLTLRGEVELRQGEPWAAAETAAKSFKLDACNPRTHLLLADISRISSYYAIARQEIITAHKLDPEDREIDAEWMQTLPVDQRIAQLEAYLASPTGDDADQIRHMLMYLDHLKKLAGEPQKRCHLVSQTESTEIPFSSIMRDATHIRAFGLDVKLNGHNSRLQIDTGASGLLVSRTVAQHAGLKAFSQTEVGGIGDQGRKSGYIAYADSIRIGNLEFQDCTVEVMDSRNVLDDSDGLIGMNVFSQFLVTLDYPMRKLVLGPLPPRPGQAASAAPALKTTGSDEDELAAPSTPPSNAPSAAPQDSAAAKPVPHGPYDRYIAPEMKNYTSIYRVGHDLILPAAINSSKIKLFILDTGAWSTTISPQAAREVTKVHSNENMTVRGLNGKVQNVYTADEVTFRFAHLSQQAEDVASFDTSRISKSVGMEISGFIGANTLGLLTIHIDYRDGLVKFDYDPKRGNQF